MLMAHLGDLAETQRHALPGVFDSLALMLSFSICEAWLVDTAPQRASHPAQKYTVMRCGELVFGWKQSGGL